MKAFLIILVCFVSLQAQEISFIEHTITENGHGNPGFYAADFDNDGNLDIVASVTDPPALKWWRNEGNNPLEWTEFTITDEECFYVYTADINDDGFVDILSTLRTGEIVCWMNSCDEIPSWERISIATGFISSHGIFAEDINNDGNMDVIATSAALGKICWWDYNGTGWQENEITDDFAGTQSVYAVDIDNDGDIDILGAAGEADEIALWYNDGENPVSWTKQVIDDNFDMAHWVCVSDIDNDGFIDVLGAAAYDDEISWWKNCSGTPILWIKFVIDPNVNCALNTCTADLDGDDDLDVMGTAWASDDIYWWENNNEGPLSWTRHTIDDFNNGIWQIQSFDIDNDDDMDIITGADVLSSGGISAALTWWENVPVVENDEEFPDINDTIDLRNYPNPFNPATTIYFTLDKQQYVELAIYNLKGQIVNKLLSEELAPGRQEEFWNGEDEEGNIISSGIYLYKLQIENNSFTRRMLLLK
ncbi:MAG: FG-GAP-like repeat-containing protein [Candidatus Cloacimonetes bacterium]|nr:FG-GAP-like repeat-containing protein [Candidatus Cloacimonadota bacterium]